VDFEQLVGLEGVGIANVVGNREEVVGWGEEKKLKSYVTYDDGMSSPFCSRKGEGCELSGRLSVEAFAGAEEEAQRERLWMRRQQSGKSPC
jgi:hypothetical protein